MWEPGLQCSCQRDVRREREKGIGVGQKGGREPLSNLDLSIVSGQMGEDGIEQVGSV